jgi:hypothetical protein
MKPVRIAVFLYGNDEERFAVEARTRVPWLRFYDGSIGTPTEIPGPHAALGATVWMSVTDRYGLNWADLAPMMHMTRVRMFPSRTLPGREEMRVGRLALDSDESDIAIDAVAGIRAALDAFCSDRLMRVNPVTREPLGVQAGLWTGPAASRWGRTKGMLCGNRPEDRFAPLAEEEVDAATDAD